MAKKGKIKWHVVLVVVPLVAATVAEAAGLLPAGTLHRAAQVLAALLAELPELAGLFGS